MVNNQNEDRDCGPLRIWENRPGQRTEAARLSCPSDRTGALLRTRYVAGVDETGHLNLPGRELRNVHGAEGVELEAA